jgi:hypothetical protein
MTISASFINKASAFRIYGLNVRAFCFLLFALSFSCSTSGKEEEQDKPGTWTVTLKGKVAYPQQGQIMIQELTESGSAAWQDTIQLKSNGTFVKKIKLTQPGYYRLNFYNQQVMNLILNKNDLE